MLKSILIILYSDYVNEYGDVDFITNKIISEIGDNVAIRIRNCNKVNKKKLIKFYKQTWKKTETSFCRMYKLNQGNFVGYVTGKYHSPCSEKALPKYYRISKREF